MKVVVFGLTLSSSWGNGHATIWRGLCSALCRRGHQVVFFEKDVPYYAAARDFRELPEGGSLSSTQCCLKLSPGLKETWRTQTLQWPRAIAPTRSRPPS